MKALLADLSILAKFLLLPAIAAILMSVLGGLYVLEQRDTAALQQRISDEDMPRLRELSSLFSQVSTNHVRFINLLAESFRGKPGEATFYRAGRERIAELNQSIEGLQAAAHGLAGDPRATAIVQRLQQRLAEYRDQMGEAVLLSSVSLDQIAQVTLDANRAYDAANLEFLGLVAHVEASVAQASSRLLERLQAARWRFFIALAVSIAVIALTSAWLARRFAADVSDLMALLTRVGRGDVAAPAAAAVRERRDEFGAVHQAARTLQAALQRRDEAERSLAALNGELEQRVEQRTAELVAARDEAQRANLAKSDFLSRMSHELRTPMNAILGFGQLLEKAPELSAGSRSWVREIVAAGRHLLDLINDVLDLSRVESGRFTVSPEPVALRPLIEECLTLLRPLAEAGGVRLHEASRHCDVQVRADRTRLKQVLLNLLSNAVKFNRRQGSVHVVCVLEGAPPAVCLRVNDTGDGLTPGEQARLFVPFERLQADQRRIEGTGIGLALSKRLVEAMDGEIGVESTPGSGSTFWVRMPLSAAPAADGAMRPGDVPAPPGAPGARPVDVLCIEDNPSSLRLIESIFAGQPGVRLLGALAPGLGLELARTHRPAVILLGINLPDMDGYAVMQILREHEATRDIPVVAISANAMPKDLARGKAAGFAAYLTKPLDVGELLRTVQPLLAAGVR